MEWQDDWEEAEAEYDCIWEEYFRRKVKRSRRRFLKHHKTAKLYWGLRWERSCYRAFIIARLKWDEEQDDYVDTGRVWRATNSDNQRGWKKYSNHLVRKLNTEQLYGKGHLYRRYFDYRWTCYY